MIGFRARTASSADVADVLTMMADFNAIDLIPFDREVFRPRLERLVDDASIGGAVVFSLDDTTIGYAIVTFGYDLEYGGRDAFLTELYLAPSARGLRLGRPALEAAEAFARGGGAHALHLMVRHDNEGARRLYDRAGYREEPRVVMTRKL